MPIENSIFDNLTDVSIFVQIQYAGQL